MAADVRTDVASSLAASETARSVPLRPGAARDDERLLDLAAEKLRDLTRELATLGLAVPSSGLLGGTHGYGANYENATFMMHPYCWCERDDCPWCAGCNCAEDAFSYFVSDRKVSLDEWLNAARDESTCLNPAKPNWDRIAERGKRTRRVVHTPNCVFCLGGGPAAELGAPAGYPAANFHHRASGLMIWWYKYIGRGMEYAGSLELAAAAIDESIRSARADATQRDAWSAGQE